MYDLSIGIRALIVSKNRVMIITAGSCCQINRAVIGLYVSYQIYGRRQIGARTRGIGQKSISETLSFSDTFSDPSVLAVTNAERSSNEESKPQELLLLAVKITPTCY